jgi:hypothetical protein
VPNVSTIAPSVVGKQSSSAQTQHQ